MNFVSKSGDLDRFADQPAPSPSGHEKDCHEISREASRPSCPGQSDPELRLVRIGRARHPPRACRGDPFLLAGWLAAHIPQLPGTARQLDHFTIAHSAAAHKVAAVPMAGFQIGNMPTEQFMQIHLQSQRE